MERIETLSRGLGKVAVSCPIFTMQILVSVLGMGVSVAQLLRGMDAAVYLPITTSIIGYWLPAPKRPPAEEAALAGIAESVASVVGPRRSRQGSPLQGSPRLGSPRLSSPRLSSPRDGSHEVHSDRVVLANHGYRSGEPLPPGIPVCGKCLPGTNNSNNFVA